MTHETVHARTLGEIVEQLKADLAKMTEAYWGAIKANGELAVIWCKQVDEIEQLKERDGYLSDTLFKRDAEIHHLKADKEAISKTASDYLHEIEQLKAGRAEVDRAAKILLVEVNRLAERMK